MLLPVAYLLKRVNSYLPDNPRRDDPKRWRTPNKVYLDRD